MAARVGFRRRNLRQSKGVRNAVRRIFQRSFTDIYKIALFHLQIAFSQSKSAPIFIIHQCRTLLLYIRRRILFNSPSVAIRSFQLHATLLKSLLFLILLRISPP